MDISNTYTSKIIIVRAVPLHSALPKIVSLVFDYFNIKGGRLTLIVPVNEVDYNNGTNTEKMSTFVRNTPSFSPIYSAMYKVWEGMAKDNIITEVI